MTKYSRHIDRSATPQTEKVFGKNQVANNAGGFVFEIDDFKRLDRFLIIGADTTYYNSQQKLTIDNAEVVKKLAASYDTGTKAVDRIVEISDSGRAPKNDPAIFALAIISSYGEDKVRSYALTKLNSVCRTATHLFQFIEDVQKMRGWGRSLRRAVANWYIEKSPEKLGYQFLKYKNRNNWTHKDAIRLSHPKMSNDNSNKIVESLFKGFDNYTAEDQYSVGMNFSSIVNNDAKRAANLIREYTLPREVVPTNMLDNPEIWDALVDSNIGYTALIRNLAKMTKVGYIAPLSDGTNKVIDILLNKEAIKKSRIHPINILSALIIYNAGYGYKGTNMWSPVQRVVSALEDAFYESFKNVEPTGKRHLVSLDVSGSMSFNGIAGYDFMSPCIVSTAMSLITLKTEKNVELRGFSDKYIDLGINKNTSIWDAIKKAKSYNFGATDCALPMTWAKDNKIPVDTFVVWTDNETWFGKKHPFVALKEYRQAMGINSSLIVAATSSTGFSIADPNDGRMFDICGFDSAVPQIIREFTVGNI